MKEYFKYANGFVNLNDENLFLTNSGNWSETHHLLEKSSKSKRQNHLKGIKFFIYFVVLAVVFLVVLSKTESLKPLILIAVLTVLAYLYLKRDMGNRYKIPLRKMTDIIILGKQVTFNFLNANNQPDTEIIQAVDEKGIAILKEFNRERLKSSTFATQNQ